MSARPVIVWFRRELRLHDNLALTEAASGGRPVVPVFILDEETPGAWAPGGATRWYLHGSLAALDDALRARGSGLVMRRGRYADVIPALLAETGCCGNPCRRADRAVGAAGVSTLWPDRESLCGCTGPHSCSISGSVRTQTGGAYGVYTPFARAARARMMPEAPVPAPARLSGHLPKSEPLHALGLLPKHPDWAGGLRETWTPGEDAARARATAFIAGGMASYDRPRNTPGVDGSSRLSAPLHHGELSARALWHEAMAQPDSPGRETFLNELLWREFSANLLWHHPTIPEQPLRPEYARFPFREDPAQLQAWQRGRTGIPIVDAGMRQLWHIGWMHNRVRMDRGELPHQAPPA